MFTSFSVIVSFVVLIINPTFEPTPLFWMFWMAGLFSGLSADIKGYLKEHGRALRNR